MTLIQFFNWLVLGTTNKNPKFENHSITTWPTCATTKNVESTVILISKYIVNKYIIFFENIESSNKLYVSLFFC